MALLGKTKWPIWSVQPNSKLFDELYKNHWVQDMNSLSHQDRQLIIKTYREGGLMIPYEEIKSYNPIRKFVHHGLFFYYEITDPDCFFEVMLMPTYECGRAVEQWESWEKNRNVMVGKTADFMIVDEAHHNKPKQRVMPYYNKPNQRK